MRTSTLLHNGGASRHSNSFASWPCHMTEVEVFGPMGAGDSFAGLGFSTGKMIHVAGVIVTQISPDLERIFFWRYSLQIIERLVVSCGFIVSKGVWPTSRLGDNETQHIFFCQPSSCCIWMTCVWLEVWRFFWKLVLGKARFQDGADNAREQCISAHLAFDGPGRSWNYDNYVDLLRGPLAWVFYVSILSVRAFPLPFV